MTDNSTPSPLVDVDVDDLDLPSFVGGPAERDRSAALLFARRIQPGEIGSSRALARPD